MTPSLEDGKTLVCMVGRWNLEMVLICCSVVREKAMSLEAGKWAHLFQVQSQEPSLWRYKGVYLKLI